MTQSRSTQGFDWLVILLVFCIMGFGVMNIYSVDEAYAVKQLVRIGLGMVLVLVITGLTARTKNFFDIYAPIFYILGVLSLVGVLIFGKEINGAKAWYSFGGVSVQPVELMKISTALMLGHLLNMPNADIQKPMTVLQCMILLAIPAVLIMLQPDAGSLFVFGAFVLALYREGLHPLILLIPLCFGMVFILSIPFDPNLLLLLTAFLIWLLLSMVILFYNLRKLGIQLIYGMVGGYLGIGIFLLAYVVFKLIQTPWSEHWIYLFSLRDSFLYSASALVLACISIGTAVGVYKENYSLNDPVSVFSSARQANFGQILGGMMLLFIPLTLASVISWNAQWIMEKLPKHQSERIMVLFEGEMKYRDTSGYNLLYSKTAIGSGELTGSGWNKGTVTDGRFVPEQWTDYIFCTVGEEWGFIGSSILVLAYALLIGRIYYLAETQKSRFSRFFGYSVGSILLLHFFVNIGMVMGLFPTVGIPLPFLSYGGSSLWGFTVLVFIFLKLNHEDKQSFL